ncbi:MAG: hypothetical protein II649_06145 [Kiritimatiellae bacterium]|nr:hypothetical protein [Kiritimatiellia bacterium]
MKSSVKQFLARLRAEAVCRRNAVTTRAMGRCRHFRAYDLGEDTFVFEKGVWTNLDAHASVLLARKGDLRHGAHGHVMTVTTGNHSVAALPLIQGQFWDLSRIAVPKRGDVMTRAILCGNVVGGKLELSQRDVPCRLLVELDDWLTKSLKFTLGDVVMLERTDETLEHYRRKGMEWRVKPLAWTEREMTVALRASRKRISTGLTYYHSSRGVHFLSYADFHKFAELAATDFAVFREQLRELTSVFEGHATSFLRQPKLHGHHEVELFGMRRGVAIERVVPELEKLMEGIVLRRTSQEEAAMRIAEIDALYKSLLSRPELADETSNAFIETLYIHLTGEIYSVMGEGSTPAFDDRRTALPGATFVDGRPVFHPGVDARSEVLLSNIRALMSKDEHVEYANVYELRTDADGDERPIGQGSTREIVYKSDRRPVVASLVEKRLAHSGRGYGSYVIARVQAFTSLGVGLAEYRLLRRRITHGRGAFFDYFIRTRCEGEPLADIPAAYFQMAGEFGGAEAGEDPQVVAALAFLMGDAAAQNLAMKKYDPVAKTCHYGTGKEIYRFGYDIKAGRLMPKAVSCCSVRGSLGWPDVSLTESNLDAICRFYISFYAKTLAAFAKKHPVITLPVLGERFFAGFEFRLRAMEWQFTIQRDAFEDFNPNLPPKYGFLAKWHFVLWSLERHVRRINVLRHAFMERIANPDAVEVETPAEDMHAIEDANATSVLNALEDIEIRFIGESGE